MHIQKDRFQVGIGGNRLEVLGVRAWQMHIMRQYQPARPHEQQEFIEIVRVARLIGINNKQIDGLFQARDFLVSGTGGQGLRVPFFKAHRNTGAPAALKGGL